MAKSAKRENEELRHRIDAVLDEFEDPDDKTEEEDDDED